MNLLIAIDGACRRNGKPDCVSSGGVFIQKIEDGNVVACDVLGTHEYGSTNQRGELLALLTALAYINNEKAEAAIVTDSEYLFNAMTKNWYNNWVYGGWITRSGDAVKNRDIWEHIVDELSTCEANLTFYHIKGHCISFGKVTAGKLLDKDTTGKLLRDAIYTRYTEVAESKADIFAAAQELSEKNNGFKLSEDTFKSFVVANTMADAVATREVDAADLPS